MNDNLELKRLLRRNTKRVFSTKMIDNTFEIINSKNLFLLQAQKNRRSYLKKKNVYFVRQRQNGAQLILLIMKYMFLIGFILLRK